MKITAILQAYAVRFFVPSGPYGYLPQTIQALKERYSFVGVPTTIQEIAPPADSNQGTVFRHGKFNRDGREIVVTELHLYHLGAAASTNTSTDDSDFFLDDLMAWATSVFKITFSEHGKRTYSSQLEFELTRPLPDYFPQLRAIGLSIPTFLPDFWPMKPAFEVSSVTFSYDPAVRMATLGNFRIERRQGIDFNANLYFSEAPLRTDDHIALLNAFENSTR